MPEYIAKIEVHLTAPFLVGATEPGAYGLDATHMRAWDDPTKLCVPGTALKGLLRQELEELSDRLAGPGPPRAEPGERSLRSVALDDLFGAPGDGRGRLRFGALTCAAAPEPDARHRIRIDEERGAVDDQALLVYESHYGAGEEVTFTGEVAFVAKSDTQRDEILRVLQAGLALLDQVGSFKSLGFGVVAGAGIVECSPSPADATERPEEGECLALELTPLEPFCVAGVQPEGNLFRSSEFLSGGVLKGTLAHRWITSMGGSYRSGVTYDLDPQRPDLCRWFDDVRFTHAVPATRDGERPNLPPYSWVHAQGSFHDVAKWEEPGLIGGEAPSFHHDWKSEISDRARQITGWPSLRRTMQTRTAISRKTRRAEEHQLFTYESVAPDNVTWKAEIDFDRVPEEHRAKVRQQLADLIEHCGLSGIGKTKARVSAQGTWCRLPSARGNAGSLDAGQEIALVLVSDALLIDCRRTAEASCVPNEQIDAAAWTDLYKTAWSEASGRAFELVRHFTGEKLAGGPYLHERFQGSKGYAPFLLTEARSVFVLRVLDAESATERLNGWLDRGLDVPRTYDDREADLWRRCPYLPTNGFGEVRILDPSQFPEVVANTEPEAIR